VDILKLKGDASMNLIPEWLTAIGGLLSGIAAILALIRRNDRKGKSQKYH
jgi:LPXTG-motif cell wall-anchored protein